MPRDRNVPGAIRLDWLDAGALGVGIGRELCTMDNLAERNRNGALPSNGAHR